MKFSSSCNRGFSVVFSTNKCGSSIHDLQLSSASSPAAVLGWLAVEKGTRARGNLLRHLKRATAVVDDGLCAGLQLTTQPPQTSVRRDSNAVGSFSIGVATQDPWTREAKQQRDTGATNKGGDKTCLSP